MPRIKQDTVSVHLRLPRALHARLIEMCQGSSPQVSLNSEIVSRLESSFARDESWLDMHERVSKLEAEIATLRASDGET